MLTKGDIRILRWACKQLIASYDANPSGDLFDEEEYQMLRAMKNLPSLNNAPPTPPIPGFAEREAYLLKAQRKRGPISVDYGKGALDLGRPRQSVAQLKKKLGMRAAEVAK